MNFQCRVLHFFFSLITSSTSAMISDGPAAAEIKTHEGAQGRSKSIAISFAAQRWYTLTRRRRGIPPATSVYPFPRRPPRRSRT